MAGIWLDTNIKAHDFIPMQYWQDDFNSVKQMFLQAEIYVFDNDEVIQGFIGLNDNYIAGIFVSIAAWASYQRSEDETPYWRTLKANGELNAKYPGGIETQKEKLEAEGHTIIQRGRKNISYYVKDYEKALFELN